MSDTYQAVFDAVRSKIGNVDIGQAIEAAIRDCHIEHYAQMAAGEFQLAMASYQDPSVLYHPALSIDGNQWCALYGADLHSGVAGFGDSPELAMQDFNREWSKKLAIKQGDQDE